MDNQPFNRLWIYQKLFRRSWHTILNDSFRWWWQWLYWKHDGSFWLFSLLSLQIVSFSRENDFTKSSSSLEEDAGSGFEEDCGRIACSENWDVGLEYILQHTQRTMHRHRKIFYLRLSKCNRLWLRRWALTRLVVTLKVQLEPCHVILLCHDLLRILTSQSLKVPFDKTSWMAYGPVQFGAIFKPFFECFLLFRSSTSEPTLYCALSLQCFAS